MSHAAAPDTQRGQILVIVAAGLFAFIGIVALVVDGGHAWGQQRDTQNGTDAVAIAGAVALSENRPYIYAGEAVPNTDDVIAAKLNTIAGQNDVVLDEAYYTDFEGNLLPGPIEVGSRGTDAPPVGALGVEANAHKDFQTFLAGVIGFNQMTAETTATARTGPLALGGENTVLPVTFPITITGCDGTNRPIKDPDGDHWSLNVKYVVPLCHAEPGNVGWLDWDPTAGGMSEVVASVENPDNPPLPIPDWHYITQTGNSSQAGLEEAINSHAVPPLPEANAAPGHVVLIPLFDDVCRDASMLGPTDPCTTGPPTGSQMWYHLADWTAFELDWLDLNGGTTGACDMTDILPGATGNGSTGCFAGWFRAYLGPGMLEAPDGSETEFTPWGTELIK